MGMDIDLYIYVLYIVEALPTIGQDSEEESESPTLGYLVGGVERRA